MATGLTCDAPSVGGLLVKLFYDSREEYLFAETSEHAGQLVMAIRLSDCTGLWNVSYSHAIPPKRIERQPFCTGDGVESYCFPGVFIGLGDDCKPIEDFEKSTAVTRKVFGQDLKQEPRIISHPDSPILVSYRKYLKARPKSTTAY